MRETLSWSVSPEATGPLLAAAIEEMNAHAPFRADDPVVAAAPREAGLVGGVFRMMSPASWFHGAVASKVQVLLSALVAERGLTMNHAPVRTAGGRTLREADVAVYLGRALQDAEDEVFPSFVPDLVVEVLSPSTASEDRGSKRAEYEDVGVREYYLLDPQAKSVEAFVLEGGGYVLLRSDDQGRFPSVVVGQPWTPAAVFSLDSAP